MEQVKEMLGDIVDSCYTKAKDLQQREVATPPGPAYLAAWDLLMIGPIFKRLTTFLPTSLSFYALQNDRTGRRRGYSYVWPRL